MAPTDGTRTEVPSRMTMREILLWCVKRYEKATSEDDEGQVVSSTRILSFRLWWLLAVVVAATVSYPFVCLWLGKAPDSTVVVALVGGITALGGIGWGTTNSRR
jgi:hypothetical protein